MVAHPNDETLTSNVLEWYVAVINGVVTQITIGHHLGQGKFSVRDDKLRHFYYRIIDASDIVCLVNSSE